MVLSRQRQHRNFIVLSLLGHDQNFTVLSLILLQE
nr:MAG TPA: hypothetical protein [Caudoviricetes sp.]